MISIPDYYKDKAVFVTGATGFVGKVLVEKLLRCCPDIGGIYCLIRPKRGEDAASRLQKMLDTTLFDNIQPRSELLSKVHAVSGDVEEEALGITDEQRTFLEQNISVVFHSAATVKFDEPLRKAVQLNVIGVRKMVQLCRKFQKLDAFVHVSTAYANCDRTYIEEMIYPVPVEPQKLIDALEWMDDETLNKITPKLVHPKPNTYTYTKQLGEAVLAEEAKDLPVSIVRPSIVTATWREPVPGWIDNWNGPSGLYIAAGKGLLRSMIAEQKFVADLIPVDLPVNLMIAMAWYRAAVKPQQKMLIYNMTTGGLNPVTWGEMAVVVMDFFKKNPLDACFRRPKINILTNNSYLHDWLILVSHLIPAYAIDLGYVLIGRKPRMVNIYNRLHKSIEILEYFTTRSWEWTHLLSDELKSVMSLDDQKVFYFDPRGLDWPLYMQNYCLGTKKYVLKEDLSGIPAARAHLRKLRNIRYAFNICLAVLLWRLLIANSAVARNSWFFFMGLVFKFVRFFRLTSTLTTS